VSVRSSVVVLFNIIFPWGMYYKTFYRRNLQIFVISWSVCPWQAYPA
jgi:hypothetical protein